MAPSVSTRGTRGPETPPAGPRVSPFRTPPHIEAALHPGAVSCARPLRDALRVLATVRYNPASSYPSSEEAKRSLLAWMASKSLQRRVDGGVLLSRGSGVRFLPGAPFFWVLAHEALRQIGWPLFRAVRY